MPFVPAPNIVMVELRCTLDSQKVENRFNVNVFHEPTAADLTSIGNNVITQVINNWIPTMPDAVTLREIHMRSLHTANGIELTVPFPVPSNGSLIGPVTPSNVTICVSLRSNASGRSARGRLYWIGLREQDVDTNTLQTARGGTIVAAIQAMVDQLEAAGYAWTIVSYRANNVPRPGGPVYFLVQTALLVDNTVDSQRRRLPGRGS